MAEATGRQAEARPAPGLYRSVPYAGLIVVPPSHADSKMVISPSPSNQYELPVISPELRLMPWRPK